MLFLNGQQKIAETLLKGKAKLKKQQIPKKKRQQRLYSTNS
jgi:hypothetical protein